MRFLIPSLLTIFLALSYIYIQKGGGLSEGDHLALQKELKINIQKILDKKNYTELNFSRMWSENLGRKIVKIHFSYDFKDTEKNLVSLKGFTVLEPDSKLSSQDTEFWKIREVILNQSRITFMNEFLIEGISLNR